MEFIVHRNIIRGIVNKYEKENVDQYTALQDSSSNTARRKVPVPSNHSKLSAYNDAVEYSGKDRMTSYLSDFLTCFHEGLHHSAKQHGFFLLTFVCCVKIIEIF